MIAACETKQNDLQALYRAKLEQAQGLEKRAEGDLQTASGLRKEAAWLRKQLETVDKPPKSG